MSGLFAQAGEWHAAHQRHGTPPAARPAGKVLAFPASRRTTGAPAADTADPEEVQGRG
ncbi:hypothetical protein [Streptomyces aidingensis]|uniref:Uncharacterized protein n=1 Tax=Streptomyces aidingensis TaxID=910347 RepID=A0A1I1UVH7_9ACTN|nr:hypothetical protein [Streptomyces aidingensis]SFD74821.1 hypothetical protein SAMN05421773_12736 [Streptomyces aidingensis]